MAVPLFKPRTDRDLLTWSANFAQRIAATPMAFGLTAEQASRYLALHDAFAAAYQLAVNPNTNSKRNVGAKNDAKKHLLHADGGAWDLVRIVQAFPGTTDAIRRELGLRLPRVRLSKTPAPATAPKLSIVFTTGRIVKVRLRDESTPDRRGKPEGALGATVLYFVGDEPPSELSRWMFLMNSSRAVFDVEIPAHMQPGEQVWLTAFWFNARMQHGPAAKAARTRIADALAHAA